MKITDEQLKELIETIRIGCTACPCEDICAGDTESRSCFDILKDWLEENQ